MSRHETIRIPFDILKEVQDMGTENGIEVEIPKRKGANISHARLQETERRLIGEIRAMVGENAQIRFRHHRAGAAILADPVNGTRFVSSSKHDYTFASVDLPNGDIGIGITRCSKKDQFNYTYGRVKALKRLRSLILNGEERWSLTIGYGLRPATGWTLGAIERLNIKHMREDGLISSQEMADRLAFSGPFTQVRKDEPKKDDKTLEPEEVPPPSGAAG